MDMIDRYPVRSLDDPFDLTCYCQCAYNRCPLFRLKSAKVTTHKPRSSPCVIFDLGKLCKGARQGQAGPLPQAQPPQWLQPQAVKTLQVHMAT